MITCIMIINCINILFWCTKHEMNASLVVEIDISRGCTWFSASNTRIKMQPFPTSSSSRNYSQYVYIDVVHTACCWNRIICKDYSINLESIWYVIKTPRYVNWSLNIFKIFTYDLSCLGKLLSIKSCFATEIIIGWCVSNFTFYHWRVLFHILFDVWHNLPSVLIIIVLRTSEINTQTTIVTAAVTLHITNIISGKLKKKVFDYAWILSNNVNLYKC